MDRIKNLRASWRSWFNLSAATDKLKKTFSRVPKCTECNASAVSSTKEAQEIKHDTGSNVSGNLETNATSVQHIDHTGSDIDSVHTESDASSMAGATPQLDLNGPLSIDEPDQFAESEPLTGDKENTVPLDSGITSQP